MGNQKELSLQVFHPSGMKSRELLREALQGAAESTELPLRFPGLIVLLSKVIVPFSPLI